MSEDPYKNYGFKLNAIIVTFYNFKFFIIAALYITNKGVLNRKKEYFIAKDF